jgi:tetratricopeptide (TPR) repeat protein
LDPAHHVIARVKLEKRSISRAELARTAAARPNPSAEDMDAAAWHARALDALAAGRVEEALARCHQARRAEPDIVAYAATEVWIRAHLPRPDFKVRELQLGMLILTDKKCLITRYYRGIMRGKLGDNAGARHDFEHVLRLDPQHAGAAAQLDRSAGRRRS